MFGYFAGPAVHVVDVLALGDPLLARLPALPKWRIGHFERPVPEGYLETLSTGRNAIVDPLIAMKYERVKAITQEPLWTRRRWRAIIAMNVRNQTP
jgi:arabinofuranosyltransferase